MFCGGGGGGSAMSAGVACFLMFRVHSGNLGAGTFVI